MSNSDQAFLIPADDDDAPQAPVSASDPSADIDAFLNSLAVGVFADVSVVAKDPLQQQFAPPVVLGDSALVFLPWSVLASEAE